jgi:glycosyltransferase involved in cell wall biosynthesis
MKILFAIKAMNDAQGGAERVIADVSSSLAERGHEISLLSYDPAGGRSFYPLSPKIRRLCLGLGAPLQKATVQETCVRIVALHRTVKKERPDVVVAFMHSMFIPMAVALIGTGIPVLASEHIVPQHYKSRRLEFLLLKASAFLLKRITALSESVKALYPKFLQRRMVAMPNPVHAPMGSADPTGDGQDRKIILNVGRLDPQKDQKTLIAAFARLASSHPDWDVRILGNGPLRGELEGMVQQHELQGRVFLPGTTPEIAKEYQQAQIFALPSLYESFGLATAEAMSFGLPPLGFVDCQGTNELIVNGENGMLVRGDDRVAEFTQGLEKLLKSAELRVKYGGNAKQIIDRFHPDKIIEAWEDLIEEVVQKA